MIAPERLSLIGAVEDLRRDPVSVLDELRRIKADAPISEVHTAIRHTEDKLATMRSVLGLLKIEGKDVRRVAGRDELLATIEHRRPR